MKARPGDNIQRDLDSYIDTGFEKSIEITLGTAGTVTTITLPDDCKGFKLFCNTASIRFAVNNEVEVVATSSLQTIPVTAFNIGGVALEDRWETRLLPHGYNRTLSLRSLEDNSLVTLEAF